MSEFHDKIVTLKELLDKMELKVLRNPENVLFRQILNQVSKRYKLALRGEL